MLVDIVNKVKLFNENNIFPAKYKYYSINITTPFIMHFALMILY